MALMLHREPNQVKWVGTRPGHNGTQITKYNTALNNTVIIHTVTAGKTLYLVSAQIFTPNVGAVYGTLFIRDTLDAITMYLAGIINTPTGAVSGQLWTSYPPLEVAAGYDICVLSSAAGVNYIGSIFGWEE
jgi:hypothetical protein